MNRNSAGTGHRPHSTPAQRFRWVRRYGRSGTTQREFAQRQGLGLSTLRKWIAQHPAPSAKVVEPPRWQEVPWPAAGGAPRWAAEIVRPGGLTVRVAQGAPAAWVAQLLGAC